MENLGAGVTTGPGPNGAGFPPALSCAKIAQVSFRVICLCNFVQFLTDITNKVQQIASKQKGTEAYR